MLFNFYCCFRHSNSRWLYTGWPQAGKTGKCQGILAFFREFCCEQNLSFLIVAEKFHAFIYIKIIFFPLIFLYCTDFLWILLYRICLNFNSWCWLLCVNNIDNIPTSAHLAAEMFPSGNANMFVQPFCLTSWLNFYMKEIFRTFCSIYFTPDKRFSFYAPFWSASAE